MQDVGHNSTSGQRSEARLSCGPGVGAKIEKWGSAMNAMETHFLVVRANIIVGVTLVPSPSLPGVGNSVFLYSRQPRGVGQVPGAPVTMLC